MNAHRRLQVKIKSDAILSLLSQSSEAQRVYAYLQLTKRFLFQCENQVTVINLLLHCNPCCFTCNSTPKLLLTLKRAAYASVCHV